MVNPKIICCWWLIWPKQNDAKTLKNDWNPGTRVLIWEYSARAIKWIPTWQGLDNFQKSLHPCAFDERSLSIGRVNKGLHYCYTVDIVVPPGDIIWTDFRTVPTKIAVPQGSKTWTPLNWALTTVNPSDAEVTFIRCARMQNIMKIILNKSCWYSLEALAEFFQMSTHVPGFLVIFQVFCIIFYWPI